MKYYLMILGLIIFSTNILAQHICLEFEDNFHQSQDKLTTKGESLVGSTIEISHFSIYFQNKLMTSINVENQHLSGKNSLPNKYLEHRYFSNLTDSIYGNISIYYFQDSLNGLKTTKFELLKIKDHGSHKYYLNLKNQIFEMQECDVYETSCFEYGLSLIEYDLDKSLVVTKQPRYTSTISPAQFERKNEPVLYHDPSKSFTLEKAKFKTVNEQVLKQQINTCPEVSVEYEIFEEQVLLKEGYTDLEISPNVFDTIIKMELVKDGYNKLIDFIPHQYESYDDCISSSNSSLSRSINFDLKDTCTDVSFLPCLENIQNSAFDNKEYIQIEQIKSCPQGYETHLSGCYKIDSIGPTYKAGRYIKLISPSNYKTKIIKPTYTTRSYKKIKDTNRVPVNCIKTEYATIQYEALVQDSKAFVISHCPNYTTRYFYEKIHTFLIQEKIKEQSEILQTKEDKMLYCNSDKLVTAEVVCEKFIDSALINRIKGKLQYLGYDISLDTNQQEYIEALTDYQKKNNLIIGVLSLETLLELGVHY